MATVPNYQVASQFRHVQNVASATWIITHNLNTYPVVDVYVTVNGSILKVLPEAVTYTNAKVVTVTFSEPRTGFATVV